jgi:predicted 3-demethylubiquinone-9 3-methyltransferase (glyoxalase superfamily)
MENNQSTSQKITTCLWFNNQAEEAVHFYTSVFKDSQILSVSRYGAAGPGPAGSVMTMTFRLNGRDFMALNGGPSFTFSPAISMMVNCATQQEVDTLWEQLSRGGKTDQCGWLQDQYGLSWQIVPAVLGTLMQDKDAVKSRRVMQAMLQMKKLDIAALQQAYAGQEEA